MYLKKTFIKKKNYLKKNLLKKSILKKCIKAFIQKHVLLIKIVFKKMFY